MTQHPITPPPELVEKIALEALSKIRDTERIDAFEVDQARDEYIANFFTNWGANQELEACLGEVSFLHGQALADRVRAARRPKPPSLKDDAMEALLRLAGCSNTFASEDTADVAIIRRALESIPDPSQ